MVASLLVLIKMQLLNNGNHSLCPGTRPFLVTFAGSLTAGKIFAGFTLQIFYFHREAIAH